MNDLWKSPNKGLYHMSTVESSFYDRSIYNAALYARYGAPKSLDDYLLKAQAMDYEATRAEYEAYSAHQSASRPSTGVIYWMLNNAWPSLHWNLFDYYLKPAGSYFGAKVGGRPEHVAYGYGSANGDIWLINHSLNKTGARTVKIDLMSKDGKTIVSRSVSATTTPNSSKKISTIPEAKKQKEAAFLKLVLSEGSQVLSRNVYWLAPTEDKMDWDNSTWYYTPVTKYSSFQSLNTMKQAKLTIKAGEKSSENEIGYIDFTVQNMATVPAYFVRLELRDVDKGDILPVTWTDNYMTLWPGEKVSLHASYPYDLGPMWLGISGMNLGDVEDMLLPNVIL
jgi:exo-1,4-beta-D-glucosaminidase